MKTRTPMLACRRKCRVLATICIFLAYICLCSIFLANDNLPVKQEGLLDDGAVVGRHLMSMVSKGKAEVVSRPRNCTPAAIEQFPRPTIGQHQRRAGGVVFFIMGAIYCFIALAVVCDEYFVPSLEVTAYMMGLSEDVAGATFLAAGSSAPEFATTVISVFVTKDDIGISGVIGSAVFNAMLVISLVSLVLSERIRIRAYPMLRDSFCYLISIAALLLVILDSSIYWYEALFLVTGYFIYCLVMWKNSVIEFWVLSRCGGYTGIDKASLMRLSASDTEEDTCDVDDCEILGQVRELPYQDESPFEVPDSTMARIWYYVALPITLVSYLTLPDVRKQRWRNFYLLTFTLSMIWISVYSYLMIWMITVIGYTLRIPDTVMGLSFIAIGVSMPDVLASVAVARDGYGDMAVSNALGSNVFDILFCMGVPWLIQTAFVDPGSAVVVDSGGVVYSTVLLLATVVFLVVTTHFAGWTLSRPYGVTLLVWYFIFLAVACMFELNLFGDMNPPMCTSSF